MGRGAASSEPVASERQRLDKWLVYARFVKTRGVALDLVTAGRVRLNGEKIKRPDRAIGRGDMLTLALPHATLVVRVEDFAERRGSAPEAKNLYVIVQSN